MEWRLFNGNTKICKAYQLITHLKCLSYQWKLAEKTSNEIFINESNVSNTRAIDYAYYIYEIDLILKKTIF